MSSIVAQVGLSAGIGREVRPKSVSPKSRQEHTSWVG
jgi:hypothetical protein